MFIYRKIAAVSIFAAACAAVCAQTQNGAQKTAIPAAPFATNSVSDDTRAVEEGAQAALNAGMPALAVSVIESSLSKNAKNGGSRALNETYVDSLIALGDYDSALARLATLSEKTPADKLRKAVILCGLGRGDIAKTSLDGIEENALPETLRAWFHIAKAYAFFEEGDSAKAVAEFETAKKTARTASAAADAEIGLSLAKLAQPAGSGGEYVLEKRLAENVNTYMGTPQGFAFAKQYAGVLFRQGKVNQALDVLQQQLEISLAPEIDKDELNLIVAAMTKDPEKQIDILGRILKKTNSVNVAEFAIELISSNKLVAPEKLDAFLNDINENSSLAIKDKIIAELALNAVKENNAEKAVDYAQRIISNFKNSKRQADALRILAWGALSNGGGKAPQYRLAASYLTKLADLQTSADERNMLMYLAANCYFRDKDFSTAADIFARIFDALPQKANFILDKIIDSYLALSEEAKAEQFVERTLKNKAVSDTERWRAEWKLISFLRANGKISKALGRIKNAVSATSESSSALKLRMMWLLATITEQAGQYSKAAAYCDNIADMANAEETEDPDAAHEIAANALLLKAVCLEKIGGRVSVADAIKTYKTIRRDYPQTEAAPLSYLYQARAEAQTGGFDAAKNLCMELASAAQSPELKYSALFEAAEYAKRIGTTAEYKNAVEILNTLCTEFPDDPRNFYAKLSQADILRLMNSFADAQKLYADTAAQFEKHPEAHIAQLRYGDCLSAQGKYTEAAAYFERLFSLPNVPVAVKAEAADKWRLALEKTGRTSEADEVSWLTANTILKSAGEDAVAKYWLSRNLLSLAQSLEKQSLNADARAVYALIAKYRLPAYRLAESKIKNLKDK